MNTPIKFLVLLLFLPVIGWADADASSAEIEYLLTTMSASDCTFIRNGKEYDAADAESHLRMKYRRAKRYAPTTELFIERLASKSSMSGKPYYIECAGADRITSGEWLTALLMKYRATAGSSALQQFVRERLAVAADDGASGILRITQDGVVLFESGFGSASCEASEPVSPDYVFMIGSITKEFTRVLTYVLEERGYLGFDDTVGDLLPGFAGDIGRVTVRQLLDHTGGVPDLIDKNGQPVEYTVEYDYVPVDRDALLVRAAQAELVFEPGSEEAYSNLGYQLLAAIAEAVTEESYDSLLQRYIFTPAGMTGTGFWFDDREQRDFANGCRTGDVHWGNPVDDGMWEPQGPSWNLVGAGGLLSDADSLGLFFEGIGDGVYFQTAAQSERYKQERMVYSEKRGQLVMGPAGSNGIFNAVAFWADRSKINVVLMTNRADHPGEDQMFRDIVGLIPLSYFMGPD